MSKVKSIKAKHDALKTEKSPWLEYFQLIGEFIHQRKLEFTGINVAGTFLNREIFDNTAARANQIMASALVGALWQGGANTLKIVPSFGITDNKVHKDFYSFMLNSIISVMDAPRAGFVTALNEYMLDQTSFGTSGIGVFRNEERETKRVTPYRFNAWDVKTMTIAENRWGIVDTIYNETEMTVSAAVDEFGVENLSAKTREVFNNGRGDTEKITILHAIEPRKKINPNKFGNKNMPIASIHIETKNEKIIKESGFESFPVPVVRFTKLLGEVYGRGSGGNAVPDAIELSAIWEALTIASEKQLDPPLLAIAEGGDLPAVIDSSAGALNVVTPSGRLTNQPPISPLFTVGDMRAVEPLVEKLTESISQHFFLDRLLDLNNDTRMTFGEAQIRNELRAASLGGIFTRQIQEGLVPIIDRLVELMFIDGRLGVMPNSKEHEDAVIEGRRVQIIPQEIAERILGNEEFFTIKFISPAARAMNAEQVQGILATTNFAIQAAGVNGEARDVINVDSAVDRIAELTGAHEEMVNDSESIKKLRQARDSQAAQMADLEAKRQESEIARNFAQASSIGSEVSGLGGALNDVPLGG